MRWFFAITLLAGFISIATPFNAQADKAPVHLWVLNSADDLNDANDPTLAAGLKAAIKKGVPGIAIDTTFYASATPEIQEAIRKQIHNFGRIDRMVLMLYSPTYPPGIAGQLNLLGTDYADKNAPRCTTWLVARVVDQQNGDQMLCNSSLSKPPSSDLMNTILVIEAAKMHALIFPPAVERET